MPRTDLCCALTGVGMTYEPPAGILRWLARSASDEPVVALHGATFSVERGEVVGVLGPNGAGKSTLLRAITTLLDPTEGSIYFDDVQVKPHDAAIRHRFGLVLPDERSFYWRLTGRQNLQLFATLAGLPKSEVAATVEASMEASDLAHRDKRVFGYSAGMKAQLAFARATLHDPELLILDEPTRSLDPVAADDLCERIRLRVGRGHAALMASHRLEEVISTCDRVIVLIDGEIRWQGPTAELAEDATGLGARIRAMVAAESESDS